MMGIVEPPEEQIPWTLRALELADRSPDPKARRWRASLYNNIGWSYHELGRFPEALGMFEKALAAREESGDEGKIRIAEWCVARGLRSLGRAEEALERQTALLSQCRDAGDAGGFVYEEMGECLQAMGREDEARPHFARAYDCLRKDAGPSDSQPERLARLKRLGQRE
jgi:tetratricopeptide (TPR) repeat protein